MAISFVSEQSMIDIEDLGKKLSNGTLESLETAKVLNAAETPQFSRIGIGKPLSVEILTVYTGDAPRKLFGGKPDLMVVSGIKSFQTFDAAPRAVNLIQENIADNRHLKPGAFSPGSSVVYYTPSLDSSTVFLSFELVVDSIQQENIDLVAGLFQAAAGLPVFAPANAFLLAGSTIVSMASDLANAFESKPYLSGSIDLRFLTSGVPIFRPGHYVVYNDDDKQAFRDYSIGLVDDGFGNMLTALVHKVTCDEYKGDSPYIILNIDGRERPELDGYTPKLASASLLEQFYGKREGQQVILSLERAMELYNDSIYREKAERVLDKIYDYPPDSDEFILARALFDAYNRNIRNPLFRVEWPL
ncbi:MAG TPA: hypothetical protein PKE06_01010 [Flavilitoribacter sp.]|nr:hypothetical protein [Flavilitoribacter sp.]HMQ86892.1 hypothetical protein [Flavilitoribacter sp.]